MIYNIKISDGNRDDLINYIKKKKSEGIFNVIDIGGSASGWSSPFIDAIVDIIEYENLNIKFFKCDITDPDSYNEILKYVNDNGKFHFSICTHTLEDILNPIYVCKILSKISNEGYIAFPSKHIELSRFEGNYKGYIHHRYIFSANNYNIIAFPKINFLDYEDIYDQVASLENDKKDLSFYWKDIIEINYVNNGYLGPTINDVKNHYSNLLLSEYI